MDNGTEFTSKALDARAYWNQVKLDFSRRGRPEDNVHIEAEFALESCAVWPHCREVIETVQVIRLLRTKVNFVSSLPRRGQVIVCTSCQSILSSSLGGLL